jgi:signal transduction histidine kinase
MAMTVWGLFHAANLTFLLLGDIWLGHDDIIRIHGFVQSWVRWPFDAVAALLFLAGLVRLAGYLTELEASVAKSTAQIETERDARDGVASALKAEARAQRELSRTKSEFLLGLSHELRTPLNGIIGLGSLLENTQLADDQRRLLGALQQSAHAMLSRLTEVLDLSRLENERVEPRTVAFSPAEATKSVEALFLPLAVEKGLRMSCVISPAAETMVIGDNILTKQILSALVSNAIKYTQRGTVDIKADLAGGGGGYAWLTLTVTDTGLGMPEELVRQIRQQGAASAGAEGGIGLFIAQRLARLMGGDLTIASGPDEAGSVVTARIQVQGDPETGPAEVSL